jgi:hypothetical protein
VTAIEKLIAKKQKNPDKDEARINDNIRALQTYLEHFSNRKFTVLDLGDHPKAATCYHLKSGHSEVLRHI